MGTNLSFGKNARKEIQIGVDAVANAVKVTLGAKGRNVAISKGLGHIPLVTKDGVTVAMYITSLSDPTQDMGAMMVKDAARQTMIQAGDGTTTSTVLAQAIFTEGMKCVDAGANPIDLKRGIDKAVLEVVKKLSEISIPVNGNQSLILSVASVAANNDLVMGYIIADAVMAAGVDGLVTITETKLPETYSEKVMGMQIDQGYLSAYFCNNLAKMHAELENPLILIYDKKISRLADIMPFLDMCAKADRHALIISEDMDSEALFTMTSNAQKGKRWAAIRSPFGGNDELEDIAAATGATVVSESKGHKLMDFKSSWCGSAKTINITRFSTVIAGGAGDDTKIRERASQVKSQIDDCVDERMKPTLVKRLSRLTDGVVVIYVGGQTEVEMRENKDRIDDALKATKAAIAEGIVPGGGVAYVIARRGIILEYNGSADEINGSQVVFNALSAPVMQILLNAGIEGESATNIVRNINQSDFGMGYNVKTGIVENLIETGIIDPAKVSRVALENASSTASMILTTECAITTK
jgi:chaperonin GroEL